MLMPRSRQRCCKRPWMYTDSASDLRVMFSGRLAAYKCAVSFTANETFRKQPYSRGCFAAVTKLPMPLNVTWRCSNEQRHVTFKSIIKFGSAAKQPLQYGLSLDGRLPQTIAQKVCVWQVGVCVARESQKCKGLTFLLSLIFRVVKFEILGTGIYISNSTI